MTALHGSCDRMPLNDCPIGWMSGLCTSNSNAPAGGGLGCIEGFAKRVGLIRVLPLHDTLIIEEYANKAKQDADGLKTSRALAVRRSYKHILQEQCPIDIISVNTNTFCTCLLW